MRALERKLLRDLRLMWSQALTIALVVASGIGGFITSLSAVDSLALARDRFYADGRFADVFAGVKRAPNASIDGLRQVEGVADVQTTLEQIVRIEIPGLPDPIIGQLIGMDTRTRQRMNRVIVSTGRGLDPMAASSDGSIETLVSEGFAQARQLKPGSRLGALINGKQRTLVVVGTALSPEFIFAGLWGMPDMRGFGVFWIDQEALAAAYDMRGAFNRVAICSRPAPRRRPPSTARPACCRRTAGGKRTAAPSRPRMPCSTTRSRNSACSARCCRPSSSAWRHSCSTSWCRGWCRRSASRSRH
jgi:putative ABC transport system permease protein